MKTMLCLSISAFLALSGSAIAQDYTAPRTEYGQPDLQGVWNYSSNTPLQRPEQFAGREYMTVEEAAAWQERRIEVTEVSRQTGNGVGGYNTF